jgi:hypothetical protein
MPDGCDGLIGRTVEAVVFTWEGAAVPDRGCSVAPVRWRVEALSAAGVDVAVISEVGVAHVDGQLRSRPPGPGHLLLCVSRGSELFEARPGGLRLLHRRAGGPTDRSESMRDLLSLSPDEPYPLRYGASPADRHGLPCRTRTAGLSRH